MLFHVAAKMAPDGRPEWVICWESPVKPYGRTVAPGFEIDVEGNLKARIGKCDLSPAVSIS